MVYCRDEISWNVVFLVGCWLISKWRCKRLFDADFCLPLSPANTILSYVADMVSSASSNLAIKNKVQITVSCSPPRDQWIKLNTGGNFRATSKSTSCGGMLRDCCWGN